MAHDNKAAIRRTLLAGTSAMVVLLGGIGGWAASAAGRRPRTCRAR